MRIPGPVPTLATLAVSIVVSASLSGCGSGSAGVSVTAALATPPTSNASSVPGPSPAGPSDSTTSASSAPSTRASASGTSAPSATPSTGSSGVPVSGASTGCSATSSQGATLRAGTFTAAAQATAKKMLAAAIACDASTLVAMTPDPTILGFDGSTPEQVWAIPDSGRRYAALVTLLTRVSAQREQTGESEAEYIWPRVASEKGFGQDSAWAEAVAAGLVASTDVATMRTSGYTGWHLHIGIDGKVLAFLKGQS